MSAIGIRSGTNEIFYVIISGNPDAPKIENFNKLRQPASFELPQTLHWYREQIIAICKEFNVNSCGIRTAEPIARAMGAAAKAGFIKRCNIEGVIIEAVSSIGIKIFVGPLTSISALLNSKSVKKYIYNDDFRSINQWQKLNENFKEAVFAGIAALSMEA